MNYVSHPYRSTRCVTWLYCLLTMGGLTSCANSFFSASGDAIRDNFKGPSYDGYSAGELFAGNISILTVASTREAASVSRPAPALLLASTSMLPGPSLPPAPNDFLSHVSYFYGGQLIGKGGKVVDRLSTTISHRTYLEALGYALYNYGLPNNKGRLFGGLGPFLGVGLWGTTKYTYANNTTSISAFDRNKGGYSRLDGGVIFTVGYELTQGLRFSVAHELGLVNVDPSPGPGADPDKTRTRVWSLNVAYPLKKIVTLVKKK